jgi:site-specific DNA-methyltransferase (adenine-specific)
MFNRRRSGEVRDAIVSYLETRDRGATVAEITEAISIQLGGEIAPSTVRSCLSLNAGTVLERTTRGQYRLQVRPRPAALEHSGPVVTWGRAQLYAGDCLRWLAGRAERSIHAVVTDPPYGLVEYTAEQQAKLRNGYGGVWRIPPSFDGHQRSPLPRFTTLTDRDLRELEEFFYEWAILLFPVLVPGAHVVMASNPLLSFLVSGALARAGFERRGEIVRLVMTMRGGDRPKNAHGEYPEVSVMPRSMWEPWLLFRKPIEGRVQDNLRRWKTGGLRRVSADQPFGDVIRSNPTRPAERALAPHPSLKPQAFLRQIVRSVLPLGEGLVLDSFAGSGSTLAAAEAVGYESIGIELDPHYVAMAREAIPRLASLAA